MLAASSIFKRYFKGFICRGTKRIWKAPKYIKTDFDELEEDPKKSSPTIDVIMRALNAPSMEESHEILAKGNARFAINDDLIKGFALYNFETLAHTDMAYVRWISAIASEGTKNIIIYASQHLMGNELVPSLPFEDVTSRIYGASGETSVSDETTKTS